MNDARVLIVEDEALIAQRLRRHLTNLGYRVSDVVASTDEAVQSLRDNPADLVLMDIVVKGKSEGSDAAGLVQREFDLPVIFLTAYADEKTLQRAELARAYGYLIKPVQERELHAMIRIVLNRHARDRELLQTIANVQSLGHTIGEATGRLSRQITDYGQVKLEDELKFALERDQFELHYQPQISLKERRIVGVEALMRWNHPTRGTIWPSVFIPMLEQSGMIIEVGDWVLDTACRQLKTWADTHSAGISMSVNLSSKQIKPYELENTVGDCLDRHQLRAGDLELEITESIIVSDLPDELSVLTALKALGVRLSVDDFGTGYSGLRYLQNFPFDIVKIDREFVRNISSNSKITAIVTAILNLAESLGLQVVVEGVEQREELEFFMRERCDIVQGFYFSPAVDADTLAELLRSSRISELVERVN